MTTPTIRVASLAPSKLAAIKEVFSPEWTVLGVRTYSEVNEQPVGRTEIREGAFNRLISLDNPPVISLETGLVRLDYPDRPNPALYADLTCVLLWTRFGIFEAWSQPVYHQREFIEQWLARGEDRFRITVGSIIDPENPGDWYGESCRASVMAGAVMEVALQWQAAQESMPLAILPATFKKFRGVDFLDIQKPLMDHSRELVTTVHRLADRLHYNKVVVLEARGFFLAGEFTHDGCKVAMARKEGKLPHEGPKITYQKEYGTDTLCLSEGVIVPGDRVIVLDDVVATGGTMKAIDQLVQSLGAEVIAFLAPYALEVEGRLMGHSLGHRLRFLCTQEEVKRDSSYQLNFSQKLSSWGMARPQVTLTPPSLRSLTIKTREVPVIWGRYYRASNLWFASQIIKGEILYVFLDPSNYREMIDVLQFLTILHRKEPLRIIVVIPCLEQGTQDRIEYRGNFESLAAVDSLARLIGYKVITFDLHALQSQFAFSHLENRSLVAYLWKRYHREHPEAIPVFPDEGAAKRFGPLLGIEESIVFRKKREGSRRVVTTDEREWSSGQRFVAIDDMVRSGGTLRAVAENLLAHSKESVVDAIFAHACFEPEACANLRPFDQIWTSDSCPRSVPPEWVRAKVIDLLD